MAGTSWSNVAGQFSIEIYVSCKSVLDINDNIIPELQEQLLYFSDADDTAELIIDFRSSGYDDPGSMYGGPDNLGYAPEGDDERLLETAYLKLDDVELPLTKEQQDLLFDRYSDEINDVELEED
jgi:hypothetical protein